MPRRPPDAEPTAPPKRDWRSFDHVAEAYERVGARITAAPARDLVALLAPEQGSSVLDVGTGTGVAAEAALAAVGPKGLVVGADASPGMLGRARERGLHHLIAAAAIDLPFRDGSFDRVSANFVIFFFTRYETALFDMLRVLRPGGRLGVSTWGSAEDEFRRTWREIAESFVGKEMLADAQRKTVPWESHFSDPKRLKETLRRAGLREVKVEHREYRYTMSLADYLERREIGASGRFLRSMLGDALWERFRERVDMEFRSRFPDPLGDTEDVLLAVGTRPS